MHSHLGNVEFGSSEIANFLIWEIPTFTTINETRKSNLTLFAYLSVRANLGAVPSLRHPEPRALSDECRSPFDDRRVEEVWDGLEIKPHLGGHWANTQPSVTD